jgi:hypothetical protein
VLDEAASGADLYAVLAYAFDRPIRYHLVSPSWLPGSFRLLAGVQGVQRLMASVMAGSICPGQPRSALSLEIDRPRTAVVRPWQVPCRRVGAVLQACPREPAFP